jgi:hypothetical protein
MPAVITSAIRKKNVVRRIYYMFSREGLKRGFTSKQSANFNQSRASTKNCCFTFGSLWASECWAHSAACRKHSRNCSVRLYIGTDRRSPSGNTEN